MHPLTALQATPSRASAPTQQRNRAAVSRCVISVRLLTDRSRFPSCTRRSPGGGRWTRGFTGAKRAWSWDRQQVTSDIVTARAELAERGVQITEIHQGRGTVLRCRWHRGPPIPTAPAARLARCSPTRTATAGRCRRSLTAFPAVNLAIESTACAQVHRACIPGRKTLHFSLKKGEANAIQISIQPAWTQGRRRYATIRPPATRQGTGWPFSPEAACRASGRGSDQELGNPGTAVPSSSRRPLPRRLTIG
jgi:hypothetical protein